LRVLQDRLKDAPVPRRLFSYPVDVWFYLVLPADDPTPFAMLYPGVYSPAQVRTAMEQLDQHPDALVLVDTFFVGRHDSFVAWVRSSYRDLGEIGSPWLRLFARAPPS
jgi:hypothetical protein